MNKTFGEVILELRKKNHLTQQELANKLHITDKAVSKWERGLSYPDITSISKLADILGVDSSYLIDLCKYEDNPYSNCYKKEEINKIIYLVLKGICLAMGISVCVLNMMNELSINDSIMMFSFGLISLSLSSFIEFSEKSDKSNNKKVEVHKL